MTLSSRASRILICATLLFLIFIVFYEYSPFEALHIPHVNDLLHGHSETSGLDQGTHDQSPGTQLEKHVTPYSSLRSLCQSAQWREGVWLHCHSYCGPHKKAACGGLNNARNRVQSCFRLAIDAGAGIILPTIGTRNDSNWLQTGNAPACPDVYFNIGYLRESMKYQCPGLNIQTACEDYNPEDYHTHNATRRYFFNATYTYTTFRTYFDNTVEKAGLARLSQVKPIVIEFGDTFYSWDYSNAGELNTIRKDLFRQLHFNGDLTALSLQIQEQLPVGYIGIHLRGEYDWPIIYGSKDVQISLFTAELKLQIAKQPDIKDVFISCGAEDAIEELRTSLTPLGYTVHDKWSLLAGQHTTLVAVEKLSFDETAVVDMQILIHSGVFLGVMQSTLSSSVAYERRIEDQEDYFETYIYPGSRTEGSRRMWPGDTKLLGNDNTKLIVADGIDLMRWFP